MSRGSARAAHQAGLDHRPCCLQNPLQSRLIVARRGIDVGPHVVLHVFDGACQHVDPVPQVVELGAGDDEFLLAQIQFLAALFRHPIPLSAGLAAEPSRSSCALGSSHLDAAPEARGGRLPLARRFRRSIIEWVFRHDVIVFGCRATDGDTDRVISLEPPRRWFASDNAAGAHPLVLESIVTANAGHALAYGADPLTARVEDEFRALFDADVVTRFVYGGTGANVFALSCMLEKTDAVVCSNWAHIAVDEAGAPERVLGAKLIQVESADAKVTPEQLRSLNGLRGSQHHAPPGVLSITQATELGTLYSADEVRALCDTAHDMGMTVHMDGARIANATASLGGDRRTLRSFTIDAGIDVLTFGGTKAGAVFGEAVVFLNTALAERSLNIRKQTTQLHSKMRYISAQYGALLADNLFIELGRSANDAALRLWERVRDLSVLALDHPPAANSLFPIVPQPQRGLLQEWSFFWDWNPAREQVRWMTAWDVDNADVEAFVAGVRAAFGS